MEVELWVRVIILCSIRFHSGVWEYDSFLFSRKLSLMYDSLKLKAKCIFAGPLIFHRNYYTI